MTRYGAFAKAAALTVAALVATTACERQQDVPPGQPMDGTAQPAPQPGEGVAPGAPSGGIVVELADGSGQNVGGARLEPEGDGVRVSIRVSGLTPNQEHGLHFHENGVCEGPDFQSAGGHFNPHGAQHGLENPAGPHAGDMPNIRANAEGVADTSFVVTTVNLTTGTQNSLLRQGGTSLMVHAGPDDHRTDPAGDSGARIACGVIRGGG